MSTLCVRLAFSATPLQANRLGTRISTTILWEIVTALTAFDPITLCHLATLLARLKKHAFFWRRHIGHLYRTNGNYGDIAKFAECGIVFGAHWCVKNVLGGTGKM